MCNFSPLPGAEAGWDGFQLLLGGSNLQWEQDKFVQAKAVLWEGKDLVGSPSVCIYLDSTGGLAAKHPSTEGECLPGEQQQKTLQNKLILAIWRDTSFLSCQALLLLLHLKCDSEHHAGSSAGLLSRCVSLAGQAAGLWRRHKARGGKFCDATEPRQLHIKVHVRLWEQPNLTLPGVALETVRVDTAQCWLCNTMLLK